MDIKELAKKAGFIDADWVRDGYWVEELTQFANLILEEAAKNLEDWQKINWNVWDCAKAIRKMKTKEE